jgi:hypothetical protein
MTRSLPKHFRTHVGARLTRRSTMEEFLEAVLSVRSMLRLYSEDE